MNRLVILDWGIGGFGFWKEWKTLRPNEGTVYFSDSGFTPYGKVPDRELAVRLEQVIADLQREHGITHCLIACHSASTVAPQLHCPGVTICGIIEGTVDFIRSTIQKGPLGLAGGRRTIESHVYHRLLPEYEIQDMVAQPLSAAVEAGQLAGPQVEDLVFGILERSPEHLALACTHYIALKPAIAARLPHVQVHDPIPWIAAEVDKAYPVMDGPTLFLTSGSKEDLRSGAGRAFEVSLSPADIKDASTL